MPPWEERFRKDATYSGKYQVETNESIFEVEIEPDMDASHPRTDWDCACSMLFSHRRYDLGDTGLWKKLGIRHDDFNSWQEIEDWLKVNVDPLVMMRVQMYDHSGITISASTGYPYNDRWDSGTIGIAYMTRQQVMKEYNVKKASKKILKEAKDLILAEIETYDDYLTGNVHQYQVTCEQSCKEASCSGFFGNLKDSGILDDIIDFIKDESAAIVEKRLKEKLKRSRQLKAWIKYKVPLGKRKPFINHINQ